MKNYERFMPPQSTFIKLTFYILKPVYKIYFSSTTHLVLKFSFAINITVLTVLISCLVLALNNVLSKIRDTMQKCKTLPK